MQVILSEGVAACRHDRVEGSSESENRVLILRLPARKRRVAQDDLGVAQPKIASHLERGSGGLPPRAPKGQVEL